MKELTKREQSLIKSLIKLDYAKTLHALEHINKNLDLTNTYVIKVKDKHNKRILDYEKILDKLD
jgi:hypothetical protein